MTKKILIVEDEATLVRALTDKFTKENFLALSAKNGKEGLETALLHKPDIILLDIVMPEMDGISMLGELRKDSWGKKVPVIMLTNLTDAEQVQETMKNGVFDYLVKSDWKLEQVVNKVKDKLNVKQ
ncbi:MAG: response regulator [Patescibacteria group bacterium]|jgi:DNA-binding response OmpR family regulator